MSETRTSKMTGLFTSVQRLLPGRHRERQQRVVRSEQEIREWVVQRVAQTLGIEPQEVDPEVPFAEYGFDSRTAVGLSGELEGWLGLELAPTLVWDHPTIASMANFLAAECQAQTGNGGNQ
ncbi:MAG: acyl carrier protein [Gammaproteobacteria bacterium]|nr:acyl carrier protein [Gammaproteobacteria bacterium]